MVSQTITARLAVRAPDDVLVVTADGGRLTAEQVRGGARRGAAALADLGIGAGDRVATLQAPGAHSLLTWWAVDLLGAVFVPLNPTWSVRLAARVVADRAPALLVVDEALRGLAAAAAGATPVVGSDVLAAGAEREVAAVPRADWEDCVLVHNSGLPGIHRGVRTTSRMLATMAATMTARHHGSRALVPAPTCFTGTLLTVYGAIAHGGSVALLPGLTAESFWPAIRSAGVTSAALLAPSVADLLAQPPTAADRDHPLRLVATSPAHPELNAEAGRRFGLRWHCGLGKTEVCGAVITPLDPGPSDGVGCVVPPFEGRVVDAHDEPVGVDEPGELVLRSDVAWSLPVGYVDDPEASAWLWRNGWMHTGWHVRRDAAGTIHTVGDASIHPIVVKRAGYLFVSDLEAEIVDIGGGVTGARVSTRPGPDERADPVVTARVTGDALDRDVLWAQLRAELPAHLVPDELELPPA